MGTRAGWARRLAGVLLGCGLLVVVLVAWRLASDAAALAIKRLFVFIEPPLGVSCPYDAGLAAWVSVDGHHARRASGSSSTTSQRTCVRSTRSASVSGAGSRATTVRSSSRWRAGKPVKPFTTA